MANSTATITAKTGAGIQATTVALTGITSIQIDTVAEVLSVFQGGNKVSQFELSGSNTFTLTASGGAYTLTIT